MKTTENIKLHIIHCKLVYSFALVWLLFSFYTFTLQIWKISKDKENGTFITCIGMKGVLPSAIQVWGIVY